MYEHYEIIDILDEADNVKTFIFDKKIIAKPGQFVMLWLPGISEKPFSLSYDNGITVKKFGPFTEKLFDLKIGDKLFMRGPYGNSFLDFVKEGPKYIIAGGTGAAPLAFFADWLNSKPTVLLGAKSKSQLVFEKRFRRHADILISTDDGSLGIKGRTTDLFDKADISKNSQFFICGPEKMMRDAAEKALKYTQAENIILSLERIMKCCRGLCGSCEIGGYRVCIDGPVFRYDKVASSLGKYRRDSLGKKISL